MPQYLGFHLVSHPFSESPVFLWVLSTLSSRCARYPCDQGPSSCPLQRVNLSSVGVEGCEGEERVPGYLTASYADFQAVSFIWVFFNPTLLNTPLGILRWESSCFYAVFTPDSRLVFSSVLTERSYSTTFPASTILLLMSPLPFCVSLGVYVWK